MKRKDRNLLLNLIHFFEDNRALLAVRHGLTMMIPLIVLGSIALMLRNLPIAPYQALLPTLLDGHVVEVLDFIYGGSFQIFSVALAVTTSVSYASIRSEDRRSSRAVMNDCFILATLTLISLGGYLGIHLDTFTVSSLGTTSTLMALLISLISGWLYFEVRNLRIFRIFEPADADIDGLYYIAVRSIFPAAFVVIFFAVTNQLLKAAFHLDSLQDGLVILMDRLLSSFNGNFLSGLVTLLSIHSMWFFGIHGSNVLDPVIQEKFAAISGTTIFTKTFQDVFTIMGGCGASLGLVLAILLFSRKKTLKNVARLALPGVLFNINEVIIFGLPVILNPIFFLPFIATPILNYLVSYLATSAGLVPLVSQQVTWTTPIFLSGYQATGSLAGSLLQLFCLLMDMGIYLPFIRIFEAYSDQSMEKKVNKLVTIIQEEEAGLRSPVSITRREDLLGAVARSMVSDLKSAIARKELFLLYQPQVNKEAKCLGAEALLRWNHPIVGFVYPPLIIRLAKEGGFLSDLEKLIFDRAAHALSIISSQSDRPYKISVNITNESLCQEGFEKMIDDCVERYGISREQFWMEITEQDALSSSINIANRLQNLKDKGHHFLIDDFGMGHASIMYLQTNTFSIVKLDGAITRDVIDNKRHQDILRSIIYLGDLLQFTTVAEFVETKEQMELLKELGIDVFQGYYYSPPIPLEKLVEWMKSH